MRIFGGEWVDAEIWCREDFEKKVKSVKAWEGDLPFVPNTDTLLVVHDGWGAASIQRVFYEIPEETLIIEIGSDYTGEYLEKAIELGFESEE